MNNYLIYSFKFYTKRGNVLSWCKSIAGYLLTLRLTYQRYNTILQKKLNTYLGFKSTNKKLSSAPGTHRYNYVRSGCPFQSSASFLKTFSG